MQYKKEHLPIHRLGRRSGQRLLRVGFIVAHDVGNPNSTARNNRDFYTRTAADAQQSAHVFVDDIEAIELVPLNEKAWHVRYDVPADNQRFGDDANDIAISIEMCYFTDKERTKKAYANYVKIIAGWIKTYKLDVLDVVGHYELDPSRRTDPINAFKTFGKTWDGFVSDLEKEIGGESVVKSNTPVEQKGIGRVTIQADSLNLRDKPALDGKVIRVLRKGQSFNVYEIKDNWYRLSNTGWASIGSAKNLMTYKAHPKPIAPKPTKPAAKPKPNIDTSKVSVYRVKVDGKQVGAYGNPKNALDEVEKALKAGKKNVVLERV